MEHQYHFGKKFYQDKKTGYWISTTSPRIRAHVWVWESTFGKAQKGYHIHHIDENKSNNDVSNLELLNVKDHVNKHLTPQRIEAKKTHMEKIRPLTKEWHASDEGREWHRKHGIKTWEERKYFQMVCHHCEKFIETKTFHQEFCSNRCKSASRRIFGRDNIKKECEICKSIFTVNKYAKTKTCSRKCGGILRHQKH